jgi:multidrug efflux pump subunit AcrA (membrane-fusion protein)
VADLSGVTAEGRLEPVRFVKLSPSVDGQVGEVLVAEGERVDAGQLIARLESASGLDLEGARTKAAIELGAAYEALRIAQDEFDVYPVPRIFVGLTPEEAARVWLEELDAARIAFEPYKDTSRKGLRSRDAFSWFVYPSLPHRVLYDTGEYQGLAKEYKKRVDVAWANYTKAVDWLKLDAALEMAKARLADAQGRYADLHDASLAVETAGTRSGLARAEIRAPFAGTITNLALKIGEVATAGTHVATIADLTSWVVKTVDLTEIDVVSVESGMPVTVLVDAIPAETFSGRVIAINLGYTDRRGDIVYRATIRLAELDPAMRWGMTAEVRFDQ